MIRRDCLVCIALCSLLILSACAQVGQTVDLSGTRWRLEAINGQPALADAGLWMEISDGGLTGFTGCNTYGTKYTVGPGNSIEIEGVAITEAGCDPAGGAQEKSYVETLSSAAVYRVEGDVLYLQDRQGNVLLQYRQLPTFNPDPQLLVGKTWRLVQAEGVEAEDLSAFTLWFDGSAYRETTPCYSYDGTYRTNEDTLYFTSYRTVSTEENCPPQAEALGRQVHMPGLYSQYNVTENQLELYVMGNVKLVFEAASEE